LLSKGFLFATCAEAARRDIYIRDTANHAWNGDRVLVRITQLTAAAADPQQGSGVQMTPLNGRPPPTLLRPVGNGA